MHLMLADCVSGKFSGPAFPHSLYQGLPCDASGVAPSSLNDILLLVANLIQLILSLAGVIAVIMIIVGGLMFVVSSGDPGRVKKGKEILANAVIGLVITIAAYAIVNFVSGAI